MRTHWKKARQGKLERAQGDPPRWDLIDERGTILANVQRDADRFSYIVYDLAGEPFSKGTQPTAEKAKERAMLTVSLLAE